MKRLSELQKLEIVLSSYKSRKSTTRYCVEKGIARSTFYRIKNQVLGAFVELLKQKKRLETKQSPIRTRSVAKKYRYGCRLK